MKKLLRALVSIVACLCLNSCLFKEPVFTEGFLKADGLLSGVWAHEEEGDPRKTEMAVCFPFGEDSYFLHYPANDKDALYYEARHLKIGSRDVVQIKALGSMEDGAPDANDETYTLLWVAKEHENILAVRALRGDAVKKKSAADVRKLLENGATDWETLFGETAQFKRLTKE